MDEFPVDHELMKSGQFADLCQTTKETLRYWRSIGLLKPVAVSEQGMRCILRCNGPTSSSSHRCKIRAAPSPIFAATSHVRLPQN